LLIRILTGIFNLNVFAFLQSREFIDFIEPILSLWDRVRIQFFLEQDAHRAVVFIT
jgi:hypothetical protein